MEILGHGEVAKARGIQNETVLEQVVEVDLRCLAEVPLGQALQMTVVVAVVRALADKVGGPAGVHIA